MAVMNIWLEMARSQFQAGDLDAALGSIDRALQVESTADTWALKERILTEKATRGERAIGELMRVTEGGDRVAGNPVDRNSELADVWFKSGFQKAMQGDMLGSIQDWDKAIKFKSDFYKAWYGRGNALAALVRNEEAIHSYDKAIKFKPGYHDAWHNRGSSLSALARNEEAIHSYDKAIEFKPDFHYAWFCRGISLNDLGRNEEAIASYEKAIEFKPDYHDA